MAAADEHDLVDIAEGLLAAPTSRLPYQRNVLLRSYLLRRSEGNVIVYNSPGVTQAAAAIQDLGPTQRLLMSHEHESMYGQPTLDVPVWIHRDDVDAVGSDLDIAGTFSMPERIGRDLEVIPTPGHTAGTTSFLWDNGTCRYLFTGDFLWIEHGEWKAVVLDPALRDAYVDSLSLVRELEFDVLVPWGTTDDGPPFATVEGAADRRSRIDMIIDRVRAGGSR
ncbi:MBL fold metallo-hydrolase [Aeromicrobium sp. Leaf350]|uniref:MBL fold metallo-hydrolase n=1 Tax=Aeromicrobium sp. Leaf350 TaxID=2876565 RepID=UPI001E6479E6|nr:MBL fold metallo-hydrolase [Aeromicrobium sp. Leaf350]